MRHTRLLVCVLVVLSVACSSRGADPSPTASGSSLKPYSRFMLALGKQCSEFEDVLERLKVAKTKAQFRRETKAVIRALRRFEDDLTDLNPPARYRGPLKRYIREVRARLEADEQFREAGTKGNTRPLLTAAVGSSTHALAAYRIAIKAAFPSSCLLGVSRDQVALDAFKARASLVCFDFTTLVKQLARRLNPRKSRKEALEFFTRLHDLGLGFVKRIRAAIPPELDDTRLLKMTKLYGEAYQTGMTGVLDALRLGDPLLAKRAIRRFADLAEKANKIAHAFGLPPCGDILRLGGSRSSSSD